MIRTIIVTGYKPSDNEDLNLLARANGLPYHLEQFAAMETTRETDEEIIARYEASGCMNVSVSPE